MQLQVACACYRSQQEASIKSANHLHFLWTTLSTENVALSIESLPFYRMVGFGANCPAFGGAVPNFTTMSRCPTLLTFHPAKQHCMDQVKRMAPR